MKTHHRRGVKPGQKDHTPEQIERMREMRWKEGKLLKEIADEFKTSASTVLRRTSYADRESA